MWTEIENHFQPGGHKNFERNPRSQLRHLLPRNADFAGLFRDWHFRRASRHDCAGLQIRCRAQDAFPHVVCSGDSQPHGFAFFLRQGQHLREQQLLNRGEELVGGQIVFPGSRAPQHSDV